MKDMTKRYVDCGNEIFALSRYSTHQSDAIVKKYRLSNNFNWTMKQLGYVKCVAHGVYEPTRTIMTFAMADKMIEFIRKYAAEHKSKRAQQKLHLKIQKGFPYQPPQQKIKQIETPQTAQQKTFSLFWGLIKFNY